MSDLDNFYTWMTEERGGLLVTEKGGAGSGRYPKGSGAEVSADESAGYALGTANSDGYKRIKEKYIDAPASRRDWGKMPSDFEVDAVKRAREDVKPFVSGSIKGRIIVSKATSFDDLRDGFYKATMEMEGKLDKVRK